MLYDDLRRAAKSKQCANAERGTFLGENAHLDDANRGEESLLA